MMVYNMKLNPAKCAFGVSVGKFLGFMVTQREIKVNPDQIKQERVAMPHKSPSCIRTFYSPFHKQVKTLLPHTQWGKRNRLDG
ncbi:hypothetical protein AAG906_003715 [Vitis piasezkii]